MTLQTAGGTKRRKLSLHFGRQNSDKTSHRQDCSAEIGQMDLRRLVAAMVD